MPARESFWFLDHHKTIAENQKTYLSGKSVYPVWYCAVVKVELTHEH